MDTTNEMVSLKLKLVIDKRKNRVLFAEADKDFVDFIFHILSLPLGTVTRIISEGAGGSETVILGCLDRLYQGVKDLDDYYIDPYNKECLLNYKAPFRGEASHGLLPGAFLPAPGVRPVWYQHGNFNVLYSNAQSARSGNSPNSARQVSLRDGDEGGYVKWKSVFMVMDDLVATPMSAVSALTLMRTEDQLSDFENREVDFGTAEALKLLKASLRSKTVFTDVFLDDVAAIEKGVKKTQLRFA